jgi:hypothetical protein
MRTNFHVPRRIGPRFARLVLIAGFSARPAVTFGWTYPRVLGRLPSGRRPFSLIRDIASSQRSTDSLLGILDIDYPCHIAQPRSLLCDSVPLRPRENAIPARARKRSWVSADTTRSAVSAASRPALSSAEQLVNFDASRGDFDKPPALARRPRPVADRAGAGPPEIPLKMCQTSQRQFQLVLRFDPAGHRHRPDVGA